MSDAKTPSDGPGKRDPKGEATEAEAPTKKARREPAAASAAQEQKSPAMPQEIPDFEERKLSTSELREYEPIIDLGKMAEALTDGRAHVKINAARAIGIKGKDAAALAPSMGLLLRDSVPAVRREIAIALGKLGPGAVAAATQLVGALGDQDPEVADEASETLASLGASAIEALTVGLDAGEADHGYRVGQLLAKLPEGLGVFLEAFRSPAVNMQVNAAIGMGLLGNQRVGDGMDALLGARTGGDARTREAVRKALEMLKDDGPAKPEASTVDGFEDQLLSAAQIDQQAAKVQAVDVDGFAKCLLDGRDLIRANAATALGALGAASMAVLGSLGALMRDDSSRVRLAAAAALDRIGDAAVIQAASDLVGALRSADEKVAEACSKVLRARKARVMGALVRGLETDDETHGRRILELINVFPDAAEILCDAFSGPAVNVQVNAAMGLGMLGPERVGKGRRALEGARTGGYAPTREAVRKALAVLDGPQRTGPDAINVKGFETEVLTHEAFANAGAMRLDDLGAYAQDGRAVVRANAATALGSMGEAARGMVRTLAALLRDDDNDVRMCAARAIDKLGDEAVREVVDALVTALRSEPEVAKVCAGVLAARKARVLSGLLRGLETDDDTHAQRILELILLLPDATEILCDAFASPAENVQVNAAIGIGMLGAKRAGTAGRKKLEGSRTGGFARTRDAVFKGLAMLDAKP
ncbi:MAG: HEAT repeat domain-containing protein [Kofleriaceae bacterium]